MAAFGTQGILLVVVAGYFWIILNIASASFDWNTWSILKFFFGKILKVKMGMFLLCPEYTKIGGGGSGRTKKFWKNFIKNFQCLDGYVSTKFKVHYYREVSSIFSTKSRVCYYRVDISEIFLCCRCQKVSVGDRGEIFVSSRCQKVALGVDNEAGGEKNRYWIIFTFIFWVSKKGF